MPSLFDNSVTIDTDGIVTLGTVDPVIAGGDTTTIVDGSVASRRISQAIDSSWFTGSSDGYITLMQIFAQSHFVLGRRMRFFLNTTATTGDGENIQFTDDARSRLGIAVQAGTTTLKVRISDVVSQDTSNPHTWNLGSRITNAIVSGLGGASSAKVILVDINDPGIDWDNLQTVDSVGPEVPDVSDQNAVYQIPYELALPAATSTGTITYSVSGLPNGLSFNTTTRTISGTPTGTGTSSVTYTANLVGGGSTDVLFSINVLSEVSLFDPAITNATSTGVALKSITIPTYNSGTGLATAVNSSVVATRSSDQIDSAWIENASTSYLTAFSFTANSGTLGVGTTADAAPTDVTADTFTTQAIERLGIAVRTDDGDEYKWTLAGLLSLDTSDPHVFTAVAMTTAGDTPTATVRQNIGQADELTIVIVDRMHKDIDWDNLEFNPAPSVADIPDVSISQGGTLDQLLPSGIGVQTPLTRTVSGLASWMTYNPLTRRITGTAPNAQSTTTITYTITDSDGDTAITTFDVVVEFGLGAFVTPVGHVLIDAALIETGNTVFQYRDDDPDVVDSTLDSGQILDGSLFPATDYRMSRIRSRSNTIWQMNDNPNNVVDMGAFFGSGGAGNDIVIHFQDTDGVESFTVEDATTNVSNTDQIQWIVPSAFGTKAASQSQGDRFIVAFTRVVPNTAPTISFTTPSAIVDGNSVTTISGTVADAEDTDGDVTVTVSTSLGVSTNPVNTNGTWSLDLTAPAVAASSQPMNVTVTATDSVGATATATRTWTVRANAAPTVTIDTAGGAQTAGSSLVLSATATPPEPGQTVTLSWQVTTNNATLTNANTATPTITFPAETTSEQTITAQVTATDQLGLTATDTVTFTIPAMDVQLMLGDFVTPDGHTFIDAALVESGDGIFIYRDDDTTTTDGDSGQILAGSLFPAENYRITRIRERAANVFQINDDPSTVDISAFFGSGGAGNNIFIHLQDEDGVASFAVVNVTVNSANTNTIRWNVPAAFGSKLAGISDGDRFILAFTRVAGVADPSISITTPASIVEGNSVTTISGTVADADDNNGDITVTATTSLGTVSTPANTNGTWSFDLTAPAVAAAQQAMDVTVTATDSDSNTATATRTWTVRANAAPTVVIDTAGGAREPGSSLTLAATATPPEPGQTVTLSWAVTTNNATLVNANTASPTITFRAAAVASQTITVRVTATDSFGLTATNTVTFTVRAANVPSAPSPPTVSSTTLNSITITVSDPASELPITQHDVRWRESGTADWTERNGVALPYTITNLQDNLTYQIQGRARSAAGTGAWSATRTAGTSINNSPTITFTTPSAIVEGNSTTTISGTVSDVEDANGNVTVTASTTLGTVSTPVNTNGTWAIILTAPPVTVAQQTMAVTVTATDSNGAGATATRNWVVRANRNPTVVIGTTGGSREPGSVLTLSATATPPESGQTVTVAWDVTTGNATLTGATTTTPIITFPAATVAQQAIIVRATATDNLGATATDTVAFIVRGALFPTAPAAPQFSSVTLDSITVSFTDPSSELPITQRDVRYRTSSTSWTTLNDSTFPLVISSLSENTTYEVQVRVRSAVGTGPWSTSGTVTTLANTAPSIAITTAASVVAGLSATAISGTVSDIEDANGSVTVTASTTLGTVSTPVNTNGTWTLTLTAPAVLAAQQTMSVTVRATDSHGLTDTATRDWIVRANSAPTIILDRPSQNVDPGESVIINATTTPPETGQSVSVGWQALDGGNVSPIGGNTTTFTTPTGQSVTTPYRVRATATDNLGAITTVTVTFTVVILNAPTIVITTPPSTVAGDSIITISGRVDDVEDNNATLAVSVRTTLGTLSSLSRSGSNWSVTLTAPPSTVISQIMTLSATVTDSDGLSQTAVRSWNVESTGGVETAPIKLKIYDESDSVSFQDDYITIAQPGGRVMWFMAPNNVNAKSLIPYSVTHAPAVSERTRGFLSENIPLWIHGYNDYDSLKGGINDVERLIERANRGQDVWVEYDDQRGDDNLWRSPVIAGVLSLTNQTLLNFRQNKATVVASVTRQPWWEGSERIVNFGSNAVVNGNPLSVLPDRDGVVATPLKLTITKTSGVTSSGVRMYLFKKNNTRETVQDYSIGTTNSMSLMTADTVTTMATVNMSALRDGWYQVWLGGTSSSSMQTLRSASVWRFAPGSANRWMRPGDWIRPGRIGSHKSRYSNLGRVYVGQRTHLHIQSWASQNHSSPAQTIYMMPTDGYREIYVAGDFANTNTLIDNGIDKKIEGTQAAGARANGNPLSMIPREYGEIVVLTEDSAGSVGGNYTLTAHHRPRRSTI